MVLDLNKCIGCQTCTVACKTQWTNRNGREYMYWNNVETSPGEGYPRNWQNSGGGFDPSGSLKNGVVPPMDDYGYPWEYNTAGLAKGEQYRPDKDPKWGPNWEEDQGAGNFPKDNYFFYLPRLCNHCDNPGCLAACPRDAIFKRDEDGVVLIDQERCQGYRYCVAGCPYKKVYFNPKTGKSEKCIFCFPRVEKGLPTACAQQCVGRIRFLGFLDDKESQVAKLVNEYKVAIPLRPDYGTEPNVFYIPPVFNPDKLDDEGIPVPESMRIPDAELEEMFGEAVFPAMEKIKNELKRRKDTGESEMLDLLIAFKHSEMFRLDEGYYMDNSKALGYNKLKPIDERYRSGKFTSKITHFAPGGQA